jgi:hypothetical protein
MNITPSLTFFIFCETAMTSTMHQVHKYIKKTYCKNLDWGDHLEDLGVNGGGVTIKYTLINMA